MKLCGKNGQLRLSNGADDRESEIVRSWQRNAVPWISAVREGQIKSRVDVTNQAVLDAIIAQSPRSLLDLGCGEGWLSRTLANQGIDVLGVDIVEDLLAAARQAGPGKYLCMDYQELSPESLQQRFDMIVCNFSLFGRDTVDYIFSQAPGLLHCDGKFLIQTLYPPQDDKVDSWRKGSWQGFSADFCDPAPWFCRSRDAWLQLFVRNGFELILNEAPREANDGLPLSLLMMGRKI